MRGCKHVSVVSMLALLAGCNGLFGFLLDRTFVDLVNNGDFAVEVRLFYDDEQLVPEALISEVGVERTFTVQPGETMSFSEDCDALQAIVIDDADLLVVGGAGPDDSTEVLRDGDDFGCGDTIVFTFDHSEAVVDFAISVSTQSQ